MSLDALKYLMLHIAKTNSTSITDFSIVYEQSGLSPELQDSFFNIVKSHIAELRSIMDEENKIGKISL